MSQHRNVTVQQLISLYLTTWTRTLIKCNYIVVKPQLSLIVHIRIPMYDMGQAEKRVIIICLDLLSQHRHKHAKFLLCFITYYVVHSRRLDNDQVTAHISVRSWENLTFFSLIWLTLVFSSFFHELISMTLEFIC